MSSLPPFDGWCIGDSVCECVRGLGRKGMRSSYAQETEFGYVWFGFEPECAYECGMSGEIFICLVSVGALGTPLMYVCAVRLNKCLFI